MLPGEGEGRGRENERRNTLTPSCVSHDVPSVCLTPPDKRTTRLVSDKLKKRLSMRYAESDAPQLPPPALPTVVGGGFVPHRRPTINAQDSTAGSWGGGPIQEEPYEYSRRSMDEGPGEMGIVERSGGGMRRDPATLDMALIGQEGFDPEACQCCSFSYSRCCPMLTRCRNF